MGISPSNRFYARYFKGEHDDFPPDYGFSAPRKPRVMQLSEEEMKALNLPPRKRDYCAHLLKDIYMCKRDHAPFFARCKHHFHKYMECEEEDYIMGLKEIERNRRLHERLEKKKMAA